MIEIKCLNTKRPRVQKTLLDQNIEKEENPCNL
ncbi:uncharacterized protein METZ01_LOCUS422016, partial [marine metagenome]